MTRKLRLVELFSGIGSQYKALSNLGVEIDVVATSEWDIHALTAYDAIFNGSTIPKEISSMERKEILDKLRKNTFSITGKAAMSFDTIERFPDEVIQRLYTSIIRNKNLVDISSLSGSLLPNDTDILTYSFPCQDLSNVGAFHGYNKGIDKNSDSRSSLLWQVGRILMELKETGKNLPKFLLMENVPTLLSNRHFTNFEEWINELNQIGYCSKYFRLNASSFGMPQNRQRLLMISVYVGNDHRKRKLVEKYFTEKDEEKIINDYRTSRFYKEITIKDCLRTDYSNIKYRKEAESCNPNDTPSRRIIWESNPVIVDENGCINSSLKTVRTITTKQDRNPNSGNLYFDLGIEGKSKFRYLTPRECMLFMGFDEKDYDSIMNSNVRIAKNKYLFTRDNVIKMAGNSIPVKLLEGVFLQILKLHTKIL